MHVAKLELCRQLYRLSKWADTQAAWNNHEVEGDKPIVQYLGFEPAGRREGSQYTYPAYDLGYLLRKLPRYQEVERADFMLYIAPVYMGTKYEQWQAFYHLDSRNPQYIHLDKLNTQVAETPEDAAAKLAIELLKAGILKPEEEQV